MDSDSRKTIEYLRAQPRDAAIRWASHHVTAERPWRTHWIDIHIPNGGPPFDLVWTILDPGEAKRSSPEMLWEFGWSHDLDVHSVWDPLAGWYAKELVVPTGESVHQDVVAKFERLARRVEQEYRRRGRSSAMPVPRLIYEELLRETGSAYSVRGGWSIDAVSGALSHWASRHAGRDDLRFEWDRDAEY